MVLVRSEGASRPVLSVIMTVPQGIDTVQPTVLSVLTSSLTSLELIVMVPELDSGVRGLVSSVARVETRVRLIQARGTNRATIRNAGARAAVGDVLVFLDAGTFLDASALARIAVCLQSEDSVQAVRGRAEAMMIPDHDMRAAEVLADLGGEGESDVLAVRRSDWDAIGGFDASMEPQSDRAWLLRILAATGVVRAMTLAVLGWEAEWSVHHDEMPSVIADTMVARI